MSNSNTSISKRVRTTFHYNRFIPDAHFPERLLPPFHAKDFAYGGEAGVTVHYTDEERDARIEAFCVKLYDQIDGSPSYITRLDHNFSELLECHFQPSGNSSPFHEEDPSEIEEMITQRTVQLLDRLPETALELPGLPSGLSSGYFTHGTEWKDPHGPQWDDLKVASYLSTNVIRLAMCTIIHPWISKGKLSEYINHTATLLDTATRLSAAAKARTARDKWYSVRAFLWTSWQRSAMIYFSFLLAQHLESGVDDEVASTGYFLQSFSPIPGMSIQEMSKRYASIGKSRYMCSWAFELLRNNPVCIGMDFRRFHKHFSNLYDRYPARCTPDAASSCKGDHPHSCQRFVGMVIKDQSAHDRGCTGCETLIWDESSYRSTQGARAVSLADTVGNKIRYRAASRRTLAVSHVWSHGQGGRPETGMNSCLHDRYESIATSMDCDSYWMDTPCIPTDHVLRREAISNINTVFSQSRVTLVCDRDLMEIKVEGDTSEKLREAMLATTIICDWNVRAWTFLEAFRARQSIYLLCRNNKILSLKETVEILHREGSLDVGILLLTVPHLLPRARMSQGEGIATADKYPEILKIMDYSKPLFSGFLTVENSGMLLSHRPASRPGDDIVIWSLLLEEKVYENAIDFWRSRQGHHLHTSFLVSTTPRVNIWRFDWAPSSPRLFTDRSAKSEPRSMGFNDVTSELGSITADGLKANWLFYGVGRLERMATKLPLGSRAIPNSNIKAICKNFLQRYQWGALLRPVRADVPFEHIPAPNREDVSRILVVVCGTNDLPTNETAWEWRGVHEWDLKERLPRFMYKEEILLV